jgi:hypothetical protein
MGDVWKEGKQCVREICIVWVSHIGFLDEEMLGSWTLIQSVRSLIHDQMCAQMFVLTE